MTKKFRDNRLPFSVVEAAVHGDADALAEVLKCDDVGNLHYEVDWDMKEKIENMLIRAIIMNFKIDYDSGY